MTTSKLPIGAWVSLEKSDLQVLLDALKGFGYRTVGPRVAEGAVVYDELDSLEQLPLGMLDTQDGGFYRLHQTDDAGYFDYVVGPHSLKNYLFPPRETLQRLHRDADGWHIEQPAGQSAEPSADEPPLLAVIGVRSCDLHALRVQDRVFLEGPYVDPAYRARRARLLLVAVNCRRAAATCFCHSMKTGPAVRKGFDLALTEMDDGFIVEIGSERGGEVMAAAAWTPCTMDEVETARKVPLDLERRMHQRTHAAAVGHQPGNDDKHDKNQPRPRHLDTADIRDLLLSNLQHPRWDEVADRCLACANCTLVCPTCFCASVEEVADLTGDHVERQRTWTSCFTAEHSRISSGSVRQSTAARYRQWLTHKLASWIDQFGTSGCIGCGRCITWCPVGIDLTEEVAAIRGTDQ